MAAPEPLLDPPASRSRSHGLRVIPRCLYSSPMPAANSVMFSLPSRMAPAPLALAIVVASSTDTWSFIMVDAAVVSTPSVWNWSFTARGSPCSGPTISPRMARVSNRRASDIASSSQTVM